MLPATHNATSEIEIRFKCSELKCSDLLSKSDPFLVFYINTHTNTWHEIGRTETIPNTHNATFTTPFVVDYYFEEIQQLRAQVYDRDDPSENLSKHDFLGQVEFTLGRLIGSPGQQMVMQLQDKSLKVAGQIEITAEEVATCADMIQIQFSATKLDNTDGFFSKSDRKFCYSVLLSNILTYVRFKVFKYLSLE